MNKSHLFLSGLAAAIAWFTAVPAWADTVGQVKVSHGDAFIERMGQRTAALVGTNVEATDSIVTLVRRASAGSAPRWQSPGSWQC